MKNLFRVLFLISSVGFAQDFSNTDAIEVNLFKGNIYAHSPEMVHLITGHPDGFMMSWNKKTHGNQDWQLLYNFPDYGAYFLYQNFQNQVLGENYSVGGFYNFYFLKRNLVFKIAEGISLASNPYDQETNYKNNAFGTKVLANVNFGLNYTRENLFGNFGINAGVLFTHYSVGRIKAPNSGVNTYNLNLGLSYSFKEAENKIDTISKKLSSQLPLNYNFVLRTGINQSPVIGSDQYPFYNLSFFVGKRLNKKSGLQLGTELFFNLSDKEYIKYLSIAYPEKGVDVDTDYKKASVFLGYEQFIHKISIELQVGYYFYDPLNLDTPYYNRLGTKYYFTPKLSAGISVKAHGTMAENLEFGIGYKI